MTACRLRVLLALAVLSALSGPTRADEAAEANRRLGRGVNCLGYDPIWRQGQKPRFQAKYFGMIREAGFQHVRINLHPFRDGKPGPDHAMPAHWFKTLDWAVAEARKAGLQVILDFHEFQAMGEDPAKHRGAFLAIWQQIAERCRALPNDVLFEILNEPNKKLTPEVWNPLLREALAVIRKTNPARIVIVGPTSWNNINALDKLDLPGDDRRLIATVHYYSPFPFTHQGASWTNLKGKVGVSWTGTAKERQAIETDLDKAAAWAKRQNRPLLLGEFGAYDAGPMESRVRWTSFVSREFEKRGWSWSYWQFDGDFIVFDVKKGVWVEPILKALIPSP